MKVGILHLSDLHISRDGYIDKIKHIKSVLQHDLNHITCLYIVVTGDIARYGHVNEYDIAKQFISQLRSDIAPINKILPTHLIIVPGNHDCCFDNEKATRKIIIEACLDDTVTEDDYVSDAVVVQNNFWDFYNDCCGEIPQDKVSYKREFTPYIGKKLIFHCYNSSWMSTINEGYGNIVMPENKFLVSDDAVVISIFHHPISWLSPNTHNNNQARFRNHIIDTSNIVMYGHEHDNGQIQNTSQNNGNVAFVEGKAFQKDDCNDIGFGYLMIDMLDHKIQCKNFSWSDERYNIMTEKTLSYSNKEKRTFVISEEFSEKINTLKIPLKRSSKHGVLTLSDVFIYPDLEPINEKHDIIQYVDAEDIITNIYNNINQKVVIEGDDQSGKTTLLFTYFKNLYKNGFLPIYVSGKRISSTNPNEIIKRAIREQYNSENINLFLQQPNVVVLIDNINASTLNSKYKSKFIDNLTGFNDIIITTSSSSISDFSIESVNFLNEFDMYKIQPLGYKKRGDLVAQWIRIGENPMTIRDSEILVILKHRLDEINQLIGNRLLPSYPIFVLTLLQGLEDQVFQDFTQTSYAHCYHALITAGLVKVGLKDDLNSYFNILKEFAFFLFSKNIELFKGDDFIEFCDDFKKTYFLSGGVSKILENLHNANIFKQDEDYYIFSYKYIYYYLIAQKIADKVDVYKDMIEELCDNIHIEKNANILIFLTHHTKAQTLIDNIIFTSMLPFEDTKPITLNSNDTLNSFISEFINEIQDEILNIEERNPKEELEKELKQKDQVKRDSNDHNMDINPNNLPNEVLEINKAIQTIKIIGQIVKNQKGDFEKKKLIELVESAYYGSFRLIGFFVTVLEKDKDSFVEIMCDKIEANKNSNLEFKDIIDKLGRNGLKQKIMMFLQYISFRVCISSIDNLVFAVGSKRTGELYDSVSTNINSPIAKIATFVIKFYYGNFNTKDFEKLLNEVKDNFIAKRILLFYVKKYLYTNYVEQAKRDSIISIAKFNRSVIPIRRPLKS